MSGENIEAVAARAIEQLRRGSVAGDVMAIDAHSHEVR